MKNFIIFLLLAGGLMAQRPAIFGPTSGGGGSGDVVGPASSTDSAVALFDGTTGKLIKNSALTYSGTTLSVPDAFGITSAGSIDLTAGGTNEAISAQVTGTGNFILSTVGGPTVQAYTYQGLQVVGAVNQRTGLMLDAQGTNNPTFMGRRARDSAGSPSAVQSGDTLVQYIARGYGATGYPAAQPGLAIVASENRTDTAAGAYLNFTSTLTGTLTAYEGFRLDASGRGIFGSAGNKTTAAWGTHGVIFSSSNAAGSGLTITDNSSSGTVATTTVFNSFAVPTLNSTAATAYSGVLANVHIAGDPLVTGNASLTGVSYGLNNEGKTRLVGAALITGGSLTLGTAGTSAAALAFLNATSGSITVAPPTGALGTRTQTLQAVTDTFVYRATSDTLTNKAITPRVVTTTDDATAVIDVTLTDVYELSAVANATTFSTTGTPVDGQKIIIRYKDAGVAKGLTWDAIFVAIGVTLPTTTTAGKWGYVGVTYNSSASKFHVLAVTTEN